MTSPQVGGWFDVDANGALDHVSWPEGDSDVGFLVLDRNQNGRIDDGRELFGTATRKLDGTACENGFDALLDLDGGPQGSDGRLTPDDLYYWMLRVWVDKNYNQYSEPEELLTLPDARIIAVYTGYTEKRRRDRFGNRYRFEGAALVLERNGQKPRRMFDIFFASAR